MKKKNFLYGFLTLMLVVSFLINVKILIASEGCYAQTKCAGGTKVSCSGVHHCHSSANGVTCDGNQSVCLPGGGPPNS